MGFFFACETGTRSIAFLFHAVYVPFLFEDRQELSGGSLHLLGEGACKLCHRGRRSSCDCAACRPYHARQCRPLQARLSPLELLKKRLPSSRSFSGCPWCRTRRLSRETCKILVACCALAHDFKPLASPKTYQPCAGCFFSAIILHAGCSRPVTNGW